MQPQLAPEAAAAPEAAEISSSSSETLLGSQARQKRPSSSQNKQTKLHGLLQPSHQLPVAKPHL